MYSENPKILFELCIDWEKFKLKRVVKQNILIEFKTSFKNY